MAALALIGVRALSLKQELLPCVGLGNNMPLQAVIDETGIELNVRKLELPMQVILKDGTVINRYEPINDWIIEAERVFGFKNQREFWDMSVFGLVNLCGLIL